jgi:hypothetical protein
MNLAHAALATCVALGACVDGPTSTSPVAGALEPSRALVPLDRFGIGQGGRGNACRAPEYRQFDFWVGNWDIQTTTGAPAGVSIISSVLGGCAVLENFFGGAGRSLNAYDDATGAWNQFFVSSGGGVLLLRGGFRSDSMILEEQRGPTIRDVWTWTTLPNGSVRQHEQLFTGGNAPVGFVGIYVARATPPVAPAPPVTACARPQSRQMDFLLGTWDVYEGAGKGGGAAQGTLVVTTGAGGCLLEESISGHTGFEGLSYAAYHPQLQRWFRTYMDTDGRYIRLNGVFDGSRMVMTGNRAAANGALIVVRVTWEPTAPGRVTQRWEFSVDDGATFDAQQEYTFVKR